MQPCSIPQDNAIQAREYTLNRCINITSVHSGNLHALKEHARTFGIRLF